MYNIAIIGVGQLGSRHLQGIKSAILNLKIYAVDSNKESLEIAHKRYFEVKDNNFIKEIEFIDNFLELPDTLDLVVIATGSMQRASITSNLLKTKNVKNIVFEKFLFPELSQYKIINDLLNKHSVKAWVNCPFRMYDFYKELKNVLSNEIILELNFTGGNWGLGCNSIHYLDLLSFLTDCEEFKIDFSEVEKTLYQSKRPGYVEFNGKIKGIADNKILFNLISIPNDNSTMMINISTVNLGVLIDEAKGLLNITNKKTNETISKAIQLPYQSQLSGKFAEEILEKNTCSLISFSESSKLHISLLKPFISLYNEITNKTDENCPIT